MTFDLIKDGTLGQHHQKQEACRFYQDTTHIQNLKEIRQEMQLLENVNQNMTFDPIKDGTQGAASPKTKSV